MDAGAYWAKGPGIDEASIKELRETGAPEEVINQQLKAADFEILKENWSSLVAFTRCSTQWNQVVSPSGAVYTGLNYAGVLPMLQLIHSDNTEKLFFDIQQIERGALKALNAR
jgi:hypothetical protein